MATRSLRPSLQRTLAATIALLCWSPRAAVAQDFQFMRFVSRTPTSMLPELGHSGFATGGDLDGDGRTDLVIPLGSTTGVYLRTASGWNTNHVPSSPGQRPVLVDLDGDGDLDLALVPPHLPTQTDVRLYENRLGAMVAIPLPALFGALAQAAAIGDVDGNGVADLVLATPAVYGLPSLVLARGTAAAPPGSQPTYSLDTTSMPAGLPFPLWPELLDADGDGDLDVLATNATNGRRLLHNTGGTFSDATATLPPGITGHDFLVSGDFDGDGRADCAATRASGNIDVLWGGAGGFTFAPTIASVPWPFLEHLLPADFDGDQDVDFLAQHRFGLTGVWNQGNRQFATTQIEMQVTSMRGVADLDGDRKADVVFAAFPSTPVRCRYQARFEDAAFALGLPAWLSQAAPAVGDVDGDGRTDIAYASGDLVVDHALGGGAYRRVWTTLTTLGHNETWRSELADMDGDGDRDFVIKTDTTLSVATRGPGSTFSLALSTTSTGSALDDLRLGDVDGDGDRDIVVAESRGIVLFRNHGNGLYASPTVVVPPNPAPRCVELADLDGDSDLDIVCDVLDASGLTHVVGTNDGQGLFALASPFAVNLGLAPTSVRAGDFDGDGDVDVATLDGTPRVYRNDGSTLVDRTPFDLPLFPQNYSSNLAIADFDDDGDLDLAALAVVLTGFPRQVQLLLNDGTGRFVDRSTQRAQTLFGIPPGSGLRAADFDDDGDVDLLASELNANVFSNQLRHCRTTAAPRLGGVVEVQLLSGPGFAAPGLAMLGVDTALAASPLPVPGLAGLLQLDPATLQVVASAATSPVGVSSIFVAVPQDLALIGLEVWFQGAILPSVGRPGFTNSVYEIVLG